MNVNIHPITYTLDDSRHFTRLAESDADRLHPQSIERLACPECGQATRYDVETGFFTCGCEEGEIHPRDIAVNCNWFVGADDMALYEGEVR